MKKHLISIEEMLLVFAKSDYVDFDVLFSRFKKRNNKKEVFDRFRSLEQYGYITIKNEKHFYITQSGRDFLIAFLRLRKKDNISFVFSLIALLISLFSLLR